MPRKIASRGASFRRAGSGSGSGSRAASSEREQELAEWHEAGFSDDDEDDEVLAFLHGSRVKHALTFTSSSSSAPGSGGRQPPSLTLPKGPKPQTMQRLSSRPEQGALIDLDEALDAEVELELPELPDLEANSSR